MSPFPINSDKALFNQFVRFSSATHSAGGHESIEANDVFRIFPFGWYTEVCLNLLVLLSLEGLMSNALRLNVAFVWLRFEE